MKRDGNTISCWQNAPEYRPLNSYQPGTEYDVAIVGGGITGITTALLLQRAGRKCVVIEARKIGFGTTGGTTAHLNTIVDTPYYTIIKNFNERSAELVYQGTLEAIEQVRKNVSTYKISCTFEEKTGYLFSPRKELDRQLQKIVDSSQRIGVEIDYTDHSPLPVPFTSVAHFSGQAQFSPIEYVYALAKAFEEAGGVIMQDNPVREVKEEGLLQVHTERGTIQSKHIVYATHTPPGVNLLHMRLVPWRSYAMAVRIRGEYPDALVYDVEDPYHYFRTQSIEGVPHLIVGGEDHKTGHEENTKKRFRQLEAYVRNYFDVEEIKYKWSSQFYETADGLPYIGHYPMHPNENFWVATGFGGNGMIYGTLSAIILRDLIVTGKSDYAKLFDPNRIKPVAGFKDFVSNAAEAVGNFIKKPFNAEKIEELAALAPGEGRIIKYEGEKIAIYKDEQGVHHVISPTCNHLGCSIAWNSAERSWDCPCHGSRYNPDGEMITGPATRDQEKLSVEEMMHAPH
jgi:glycine/D-amino acid oxidase-like deaminating enzyme/nitrite reductase/ring-hydroxylating ferredoxin subunit